ncbi:MAG: hypothetical protein ACXVA9_00960 [Bdellovibrionales bacterium]
MSKKSVIITTLSLLLATQFLNSSIASAGDIEWSGLYRIEGNSIQNSELRGGERDGQPDSGKKKKLGYGLSHLVLRPKITAGDGLTIYGQFDIFNGATDYANSQMGAMYGDGVRQTGAGTSTSAGNSNSLSRTQKAETIEVSQLYMTLNQEFSQLIVGRAPMQFGLGMTYSAGRGLFDHWYDTSDMVGYKVIFGNIYFLPMIGRPSGGTINNSDNIDDYMIHVQYENPESDIEMGVFYKLRHSGDQGSDAPIGVGTTDTVLGGTGAKNSGGINTKTVNVYALRDNERFRLGMEASFMSGESGVQTANGDKVEWGGFGIAGEFEYRPEASRWKWGLKAGSASGDDPSSDAKYEGFQFNRNYDVAMLLFNHPLGQDDFLRSRLVTGSVNNGSDTNINKADVEAISNVMYLAPVAKYAFNDRWSWDNSIITGWLSANPIKGSSGKKDIGYEFDSTLNFTPRKGVAWVNQIGFLFPGAAWKGGADPATGQSRYDATMAYGFSTKAAISF